MNNIKDDKYYICKALSEIKIIEKYTKNIDTYHSFVSDVLIVDGVMFRLIQLVEHIKNLSEEFKKNHSNIPWGDIIGFRNGIVHEYGKTDYTIVYEIVTIDLKELKTLFEETL